MPSYLVLQICGMEQNFNKGTRIWSRVCSDTRFRAPSGSFAYLLATNKTFPGMFIFITRLFFPITRLFLLITRPVKAPMRRRNSHFPKYSHWFLSCLVPPTARDVFFNYSLVFLTTRPVKALMRRRNCRFPKDSQWFLWFWVPPTARDVF